MAAEAAGGGDRGDFAAVDVGVVLILGGGGGGMWTDGGQVCAGGE